MKEKILVFNRFYLPGYKAGGPIRTLANLVDRLGTEFDFYVVTTDRDSGDSIPYARVERGEWRPVGLGKVMYLSASEISVERISRIISELTPDLIYLNSFFDPVFTQRVLWWRRFKADKNCPVLLAPRGEFSPGALAIKPMRKRVYRWVARVLGLHRNMVWQASSQHEKEDILAAISDVESNAILQALDVAPVAGPPVVSRSRGAGSALKVCFLSRISPKKNLDFALLILAGVKGEVEFTIYGPISDAEYWRRCQDLISALPGNIQCRYEGVVHPDNVHSELARHDLFLFPTHGENYGHVIQEALVAGLVVVISDQTPWSDLEREEIGWSLPLSDTREYAKRVDEVVEWGADRLGEAKKRARTYGIKIASSEETLAANRVLLTQAILR